MFLNLVVFDKNTLEVQLVGLLNNQKSLNNQENSYLFYSHNLAWQLCQLALQGSCSCSCCSTDFRHWLAVATWSAAGQILVSGHDNTYQVHNSTF